MKGEQGAGELLDVADISTPAASRHLKVERRAGVIEQRIEGQRRIDSVRHQAMDYRVPENTARVLADVLDGDYPILDVGAGTGLVGRWLARLGISPVDGLDISPEMLAVAAATGAYVGLLAADLTRKLPIADAHYGAFVSAGTFTLGHVGPEALDELLRIGRQGAVYVLTVNPDHYHDAGFADAFLRLGPRITGFSIRRIAGYGPGATGPHRDDVFNACIFRKA